MNVLTDPKQAGKRLLQFCREGRLVQGAWHDEVEGREVACLLNAAAGISEATQCPASLMPAWVAIALPSLFDKQAPAHSRTFARRWGEAMVRGEWTRIDWDAVRSQWMAFVKQQAKNAADSAGARAADAYAAAEVEVADAAAGDFAFAAAAYAAAAYAAAAYAYVARADAYAAADAAAAVARVADAQADALMSAIEHAMEVARG